MRLTPLVIWMRILFLINRQVVSVTIDAFDSLSNTPLVEKINKIESQIIEGKLVLVGDDVKPASYVKGGYCWSHG